MIIGPTEEFIYKEDEELDDSFPSSIEIDLDMDYLDEKDAEKDGEK